MTEKRNTSEADFCGCGKCDDGWDEPVYRDSDWLQYHHHSLGLSQNEMADLVGVSQGTIYQYMKKNDIEADRSSNSLSDDAREKLNDPEWIEERYWQEGMSTRDIANELGVDGRTVRGYMDKYDIERREFWDYQIEESEIEKILENILDDLGVEYEREEGICGFPVDVFLPEYDLIIEADGVYWHAHPETCEDGLDHRQTDRVDSEFRQDAATTREGYETLRIWESDLRERPDEVKWRVRQILEGSRVIVGAGSLDSAYLFSDHVVTPG